MRRKYRPDVFDASINWAAPGLQLIESLSISRVHTCDEEPVSHEPDISSRKVDHIELCARQEVESRARTTLLEEVELLHDALPEVDFDEIDLSLAVLDRVL